MKDTSKVTFTFRHTDPSEALKAYATEKVEHCLERFGSDDSDAQIILSCEKRDHIAEAIVRARGVEIAAKSSTDDMYAAIDKMVDTMSSQLRKIKEKQTEKRGGAEAQELE